MFLTGDAEMQTWLYIPRGKIWKKIETGGQLPTSPLDHGQVASDGKNLYVLAGFGGEDAPPDAGLMPRGALWMLPLNAKSDR